MSERALRNDGYVSPTTVSDLRDSAITEMARLDGLALAAALKAIGEPHLGAAALICFEWHQRPENVLAGNITWHDYRHARSPHVVKTSAHRRSRRRRP